MSSIVIDRENYFNNILSLNRYSIQDNLNKIDKPVDKNEWGMPAHMVNAYYHPLLIFYTNNDYKRLKFIYKTKKIKGIHV